MKDINTNDIEKIKKDIKKKIDEYMDELNKVVSSNIEFFYKKGEEVIGSDIIMKSFLTKENIFSYDEDKLKEELYNLDLCSIYEKGEADVELENKINLDKEIIYINYLKIKGSNEKIICLFRFQGLEEDTIYIHRNINSCSFLKFFLNKFFDEYRKKDSSKTSSIYDENVKDQLSSLTREFISNNAKLISDFSVNKKGKNIYNNNLFDELNYISTLKYEGSNISAKLLLINKSLLEDHINFYVKLEEKIDFTKHAKIRKLLEISDDNIYLISDDKYIYGLGKPKNLKEIDRFLHNNHSNRIFVIDFVGRFEYKLKTIFVKEETIKKDKNAIQEEYRMSLKERTILNIKYGKPSLRENIFSKEKLQITIETVFKEELNDENYKREKISNILRLVDLAKNQKHGTMVVITKPDLAKLEVEKLKQQSIKINKTKWDDTSNLENIIERVTSIDGALYLDIEGYCHAIGVILDGVASGKGDSSRGARYNSAIKYENKDELKNNCVIIVISEDGMIDIIPDMDKNEKESNILINEVKSLINKVKYKDALDKIQNIENLNYESAEIYYIKGSLSVLVEKKYEKAIADFTKAIDIDKNYKQAYNNRGFVYKNEGKYEDAIADFTKAIDIDKKLKEAYDNRGNVYQATGEYEKAIADFTKVIDIDENCIKAYKKLNIIYKKLIKRYPDKETEYTLKIQANDKKIKEIEEGK